MEPAFSFFAFIYCMPGMDFKLTVCIYIENKERESPLTLVTGITVKSHWQILINPCLAVNKENMIYGRTDGTA